MTQSKKWDINAKDVEKLLKNALVFSSPAIIVFLLSLQSGADLNIAAGAGLQALLAIAIDFFRKLKAGE